MTKVMKIGEKQYPRLLFEISDPPETLYYSGNPDVLERPCLALVGSRKCTKYGEVVAKRIAGRAAENGITVVSGMAMGIDSAAHIGCLEAGGKNGRSVGLWIGYMLSSIK